MLTAVWSAKVADEGEHHWALLPQLAEAHIRAVFVSELHVRRASSDAHYPMLLYHNFLLSHSSLS